MLLQSQLNLVPTPSSTRLCSRSSSRCGPARCTLVSSSSSRGSGGPGGGGGHGGPLIATGGSGDSDSSPANSTTWPSAAATAAAAAAAVLGGLALVGQAQAAAGCLSSFWEVNGDKWRRYVLDESRQEFVLESAKTGDEQTARVVAGLGWLLEVCKSTMLPVGYPSSVTEDYTEYTLWRLGQIVASQISGVLTTQALLYAVGLGKGAIPTAAATNWVLKDGIGYLSKIVLSKYGRHFDIHPKAWRLLSDLVEDVANGLELLTPTFPQLFVPLTVVASAGKSASGLIQAATRSCFYAGFAAEHNFAEVIAKGEAQGMLGKWIGIALGIGISAKAGASGPLLVISFGTVTTLHILCNLKSYQAVQLRSLNLYRAGLLLGEYLGHSRRILSVKEANAVEPIFGFQTKDGSKTVCEESIRTAVDMAKNLQLGVRFAEVAATQKEADNLLQLYQKEQYILAPKGQSYKVVLKEEASPYDMLRAVAQACYMKHIQRRTDCSWNSQELLRVSYDTMSRNFDRLLAEIRDAGWMADGLVSRPAANRLKVGKNTA